MLNLDLTNNSRYGNLGEVFAAYAATVRPHAHREPLRAELLGSDNERCHEAEALTILQMIAGRKDDGVSYTCETDLTGEIPVSVIIRASCTQYFWWFGHEWKPWTEYYNPEKGCFDLYPYINPHGTDYRDGIRMTTLVDHKTGEILKDSEGRNFAVYGYLTWTCLRDEAERLFEQGFAFDFCQDGIPTTKLAHLGPKGCLIQNPATGKWRAAWS